MGYAKLSSEDAAKVVTSTSEVLNGEKTILDYVEELRPELLNAELQEVGLTKLVKLLKALPADKLTENEVGSLLEFLLLKLEASALRSGCVIEGVHHLVVHCTHLPENAEIPIFQAIYNESTVQCFVQEDRRMLYEVLDWFLKHRLTGLKTLRNEFIQSFMRATNGERDPRCLLQVFQLYLEVVKNFDLGVFCEDFFELLAVYYPIEYVPADETQVSRAMLVAGLESCLLSHKSFAFFCYQLISDKLLEEETEDSLRIEIFEFLSKAISVFPSEPMRTFLDDYLTVFRRVCLNPSNKSTHEIAAGARHGITAVVKAFSKDAETIKTISDTMVENCEPFVLQAEMGLTAKALNILAIVAQADPKAAEIVLPQIMYWLSTLINADTVNAPQNRKEIMIEAVEFLPFWMQLTIDCGFVQITGNAAPGFIESLRRIEEAFGPVVFATEYKIAELLLANKEKFSPTVPEVDEFIKKLVWRAITDLKVPKPAVREAIHAYITAFVKADFNGFATLLETELSKRGLEDTIVELFAFGINDLPSLERFGPAIIEFLSKGFDADVVPAIIGVFDRNKANTDVTLQFASKILNVFLIRALAGEHDGEKAAEFLQAIFLRLDQSSVNELKQDIVKAWQDSLKSDNFVRVVVVSILAAIQTDKPEALDQYLVYLKQASSQTSVLSKAHDQLLFAKYMLAGPPQPIPACADGYLAVKASFLRSGSPAALADVEAYFTAFEATPASDLTQWRRLPDIINFSTPASDPTRNRYRVSILWRQRVLCQFIPVFVKWFDELENLPEHKAIFLGLLEPLLSSAQLLPISLNDELRHLLPVLTAALDSLTSNDPIKPEDIPVIGLVVSGLVQLLRNAASGALPEVQLKHAIDSLQAVLKAGKTVHLPQLLDALDALDLIAKKSAPEVILPSFAATVRALMLVAASPKRVLRQKVAAVRNTWELAAS
uniref:MMS19 nucleotide excision repair protein n=1 Tax=Panagrellus redivivus TaxID=6233 RepID=A0A7E4VK91_PANRE